MSIAIPRSFVYKGINGLIQMDVDGTGSPINVARVENMNITVDRDLTRYYQVGRQTATEIIEGKITIDGTINKAIWDGRLLKAMVGTTDQTPPSKTTSLSTINKNVLREVPMKIIASVLKKPGEAGKAFQLELSGVKISRWAFTLTLDGVIMENVTFMATDLKIVSTDTGLDTI